MKIAGIIAEYNPFHTGHAYHIEETRRQTGADYVIVVMSGDFVQRGAPAFLPKHTRAKMALLGGADLVFELPATHACQSAEIFAQSGVDLLHGLGCVDVISFGSESGNLQAFQLLGDFLSQESLEYQQLLQESLKKGISFPAARQVALETIFSSAALKDEIHELVSSPNNILGIEYCKALKRAKSPIEPFTITRAGSGYHDQILENRFPSASAIRAYCFDSGEFHLPEYPAQRLYSEKLAHCFPKNVFSYITEQKGNHTILTEQDFSLLFRWMLHSHTPESLSRFMDINTELANRMINTRYAYENFSQYISSLKTKELTYSRLCRAMFHILLDIQDVPPLSYARLLGFKKTAAPVLGKIKKQGTLPLVTKLADVSSFMTEDSLTLLDKNVKISHLCESVLCEKYQKSFEHEFTKQLVII